MSIETRFCALLLLAALFPAAPAFSEQNAPASQSPNSIHLDVVVTPRSGTPVAGLKQQDFSVLDNKISQPIQSFQAVSGDQAPMQIILLVDGVNTPYVRLAYVRQQIDKFLRSNGGHLAHPISLAIFTNDKTRIQNGATTDGNALSKLLDNSPIGLRTIHRSAGIYGADERIQLSLQTLRQLAALEAGRPGPKIILWVSHGWPLLSGPRIDLGMREQKRVYAQVVALTSELRQAHITLYSIDPNGAGESLLSNSYFYQSYLKGVDTPNDVQLANLSLQVLAAQSGGLVLAGSNDVAGLLARCVKDAGNYYELTFAPSPAEPAKAYHQIEVKLTEPGLTARTRHGYYAETQ
ncbi:MAG TPA: VWA domain-containing protein [Edaphobacter sp.]|uniref:VWA domain-containing protein n=1 Tax=Edaphobacter sp. TaxID=1934404 RepID=UPI002BBC7A33|nr:VWA domain-containing protein [Edaphobacter sp.]HUZ96574.1 VWA domain-containing protein [Edaphobacter sp.]